MTDDLEGRMVAASELLFLEIQALAERYRLNHREALAMLAMAEQVWVKETGIRRADYNRLNRMRQDMAKKELL